MLGIEAVFESLQGRGDFSGCYLLGPMGLVEPTVNKKGYLSLYMWLWKIYNYFSNVLNTLSHEKVVKLTFYFHMGPEIKNNLGPTLGDYSFEVAKNCCNFYWIERVEREV